MNPYDSARPEHPEKRWFRRLAASAVVVIVVIGAVLALRPDLHNYVGYRFASHTGTPPVLAAAVPPTGGDAPPIRFAVAGDVGTGGSAEFRTAAAMDRLEGTDQYEALMMLGDNVYPTGDPSQVRQKVLEPFAAVLDAPTRLLPVLGNHDVKNDNGDAQAAALGMPGRWYSTTIGDTLVLSLDSTRPDDPEQASWLADTLKASEATWKIATMHHPPYSGGYHGSSLDVRDAFSPMFEKFGVQLVLSGHDHDFQRSEMINGVTYVVSGAAAETRDSHLADFSVAAWSQLHFLDIGVWPDRMEVRAVDQDGNVFDEVTLAAVTDASTLT